MQFSMDPHLLQNIKIKPLVTLAVGDGVSSVGSMGRSLPIFVLLIPESSWPIEMVDVVSLIIAVILFVALSPGLLFQIPGEDRPFELGTQHRNLPAVLVHAALFLTLFYLLQLGFGIHGGTRSEFI